MSIYTDLFYKYQNLGLETTPNGTVLIGKAPHIASEAWLNEVYKPLSQEDISKLESDLNMKIPDSYRKFLMNESNGLCILVATFSLDGLRTNYIRTIDASRQPFSILTKNIHERPSNAKDNYLFIGGYNWDGSCLYIDAETNFVHYCDRWDATSLYKWDSFDDMLISELNRIYLLHDVNGVQIDEDIPTIPIIK